MKSAHVVPALALASLSGLALGQTAPVGPNYYPQCWFWQLPADANLATVIAANDSHTFQRFIPLINILSNANTTPQDAVQQGISRITFATNLGIFYPEKFGLLPQNFKQDLNGPIEGRLISIADRIDFDIDGHMQNGDPDPDYPEPWNVDINGLPFEERNTFNTFVNKNPFLTNGIADAHQWNVAFAQAWREATYNLPPHFTLPLPVPARICFDNEDAYTNTGPNLYPFALYAVGLDSRFATHGIAGFPGGTATQGIPTNKTLKQIWDADRATLSANFIALNTNGNAADANPWLAAAPVPVRNRLENGLNFSKGWQDWDAVPGSGDIVNQDFGAWYMKLNQRIRDAAKKTSTYDIWTWAFRNDTGVVINPQPFAKISNYGDFDCVPGTQDFGWHYDGKLLGLPGPLVRINDRGQYDTFQHYTTRTRRSSGRWFLRDDYRASADFSAPVLYVANVRPGLHPLGETGLQRNPYVPYFHPESWEDRWDASLREHRQTLESIILSAMIAPDLVSNDLRNAPWKTISPWIVSEGVNANEDGRDEPTILTRDDSRRQLALLRSKAIEDIQIFNPGPGGAWEVNRSTHYPDFIHVYRQVFEPHLRSTPTNYPLYPRHGLFEPSVLPSNATVWNLSGNGFSSRPPVENVLDTNPRKVSDNPVVTKSLYATVHESGIGGGNIFNASPDPRQAGFFVQANLREADLTALPEQSYRVIIEAEVELIAAPALSRADFENALATPLVACGYNIDLRGVVELRKYNSTAMYKLRFDEHPDDAWAFAVPLDASPGAGQIGAQSLVRILGTQGDVGDPLRASVSVRREFTLPGCVSVSPNTNTPIWQFISPTTSGAEFAVSFQWRPAVSGTTTYPNSMMRVRYDLIQVSRVDASEGCSTLGAGGGVGEGGMMAAIQQPSADVDRSGDITMDDADIFFNAFENGGGEADQNVDGEVTPEDIVQFLQSYSGDE